MRMELGDRLVVLTSVVLVDGPTEVPASVRLIPGLMRFTKPAPLHLKYCRHHQNRRGARELKAQLSNWV